MSKPFAFSKYHALGNDYLVIDPARFDFRPDPETIRTLCDRHQGIGSDGILLGPTAVPGDPGTFGLRIFNPDGSEAEKSGNGLRIFARYLLEEGYAQFNSWPRMAAWCRWTWACPAFAPGTYPSRISLPSGRCWRCPSTYAMARFPSPPSAWAIPTVSSSQSASHQPKPVAWARRLSATRPFRSA